MHGLVNKALQCFLRDTFGPAAWLLVARQARLGFENFEATTRYAPTVTELVIGTAVKVLARPRDLLLEDMGTYLVSHPNSERIRRLLRFGGTNFVEFLHSLDDLPGRGRLALPHLDLPALELADVGAERFSLQCRSRVIGGGHVLVGLLRAMADDYGSLVLIEHQGRSEDFDVIGIQLLDVAFAEGRQFVLSDPMAE
jgi:hypothetical protein